MPTLSREAILEAVREAPPEEQREIAREILQTAPAGSPSFVQREPPPAPDPHAASALALRGIARTDTPLDDERLLDESRMERYS